MTTQRISIKKWLLFRNRVLNTDTPSKLSYASNLLFFVAALTAISNFLLLVFFSFEFNLPSPTQDTWSLVPWIENAYQKGSWFNNELFSAQNSHRYPLLRLSFYIDFKLFSGSNFSLIVQYFLLLNLLALIFYYALKIKNSNRNHQTFFLLLF